MKNKAVSDQFSVLFLNKIALKVLDFYSALTFTVKPLDTNSVKNRGYKKTSTSNFKTPLQMRILIASREQ